jgi:hypothetical protein
MMNRRKRIGFVVDSHSVHLSRLIFCRYGLGEVLMFTSVFSFLVSVVAGGFYCRGLTFLLLGGLFTIVVLLSFFSARSSFRALAVLRFV